MPSIENPAWYERASFTAPGRADDFLRRIDEDECISFTGSTQSPFGYVMLVRITRDMIAEYVATAGDPWMSEQRNFPSGWYIVRNDELGFVHGIGYGGACDNPEHAGELCADTHAEEQARADFAEAEQAYGDWYAAVMPEEV